MALRVDLEKQLIRLAVKDLVMLGPRSGDYRAASTTDSTSLHGQRSHRRVQERRVAFFGPDCGIEVGSSAEFSIDGWRIKLRGQMDCVLPTEPQVIEEIKSSRRPLSAIPIFAPEDAPAYFDQLRAYLALWPDDGPPARGRLCLVAGDDEERIIPLETSIADCQQWLNAKLRHLVERMNSRKARREKRAAMQRAWPFSGWRGEQQDLARAISQTCHEGGVLLGQAPTGAGKTMAALWAALQVADATGRTLIWATSRGPQQVAILEALDRLNDADPLHPIQLGGRERMCLLDSPRCTPEECSFARGHYDRLALHRAQAAPLLRRSDLRSFAALHELCPYDLALDRAEDCELVVCDVAQVLDPQSRLNRLWPSGELGETILVVDEAHELLDRALDWGSAALHRSSLQDLCPGRPLPVELRPLLELAEAPPEFDEPAWTQALDAGLTWLASEMAELLPGQDGEHLALLRQLTRLEHIVDFARSSPEAFHLEKLPTGFTVECLDPAPLLAPSWSELHAAVLLSATLFPTEHFTTSLGCPDAASVQCADPFPPERRLTLLATGPSTRFRHRQQSAQEVAQLIQTCAKRGRGHWLVYFPSFDYRDQVMQLAQIQRPVLEQPRGSSDGKRSEILARLSNPEPMVLAAVLGGVFGSGIDPPPCSCSGVVVVSPALPPISPRREQMAGLYEQRGHRGFDRAYTIPGMHRVVQAAGRALRSPEGQVAIVLIGQRYAQRLSQSLLPSDWRPQRVRNEEELAQSLDRFFGADPGLS